MSRAHDLRREINQLQIQLDSWRRELTSVESNCRHSWSDPEYKPEHRPGYHDPGDPPGTMGVDRRLPMDVPPETIDKWKRTCKNCGKTEETTQTEVAKVVHRPRF